VKIDHQAVAVLLVGPEQETLGPHLAAQVEHHAQVIAVASRGPHATQQAIALFRLGRVWNQLRRLDVDDQPIRVLQGQQRMLNRLADVEHQACVVGCRQQARTRIRDTAQSRGFPNQTKYTILCIFATFCS